MRATRILRRHEGNAMIEFALSAPLIFTVLVGTFQFGYAFYVYNQLQVAVRSGVRYASQLDYEQSSGGCTASTVTKVKNLVVYGTPAPGQNDGPIIRGLAPSNVVVSYNPDAKGVPTNVEVSVANFSVDALFTTFNFTGKPWASIPYTGRYSPKECS
jgi:Flp pilus assembly protein TadG